MKKRSIAMLGGFIAAVFILAFFPVSSAAAPITLSYANFPPAPTFPCVQMERWSDEVEKRTGGKIAINTYPGSTLLGAKNMMDGVIAGTADIGCLCMAYQPGRFIVTNATALPLGFPNATVASLTLWDIYRKHNPDAFAKVKALTMFTCAPANIYAKQPVKNLEDFKTCATPPEARSTSLEVVGCRTRGHAPVGVPRSPPKRGCQGSGLVA